MPQINESQRLSAAAQQRLGMPEGLQFHSPFPFAGMNTQASRIAIADQEFYWLENFIRIGDGKLRTLWDKGTALYTITGSATIVSFYWFYIGATSYVAVFLSDGTAVQVQKSTGAITNISNVASTFYVAGGNLPSCVQWGSDYLLISNNNTSNDYWIWDGAVLYSAGTISPVTVMTGTGTGYNSTPTVTAYGGSGSGIVFSPVIDAGGVVLLNVVNPGSGYESNDEVQVAFSGGGSDNGAILKAVLSSGAVSGVEVTAQGSGYSTASVSFSGGGGGGAAATAVVIDGTLSSIAVTAGGTGYTSAPTVTFTGGGGSGAAATAVVVSGAVTEIDITALGTGYTSAPTIGFTGGGGSGAAATATIQGAYVSTVTVTNPGSGYTSPPSVSITGDGSGATGTAYITSGSVSSVTVTNGGTNYRYPPGLTIQGGGGAGATALALLTPTAIANIDVTNGGSGYYHAPQIIIDPPQSGTQATATATVNAGSITGITITNAGSGYTRQPEVTIIPDWRDTSGVTSIGVNDPGSGYSADVTVTLSGGGATVDAVAYALINSNKLASVVVAYPGYGYTSAPTVTITGGGGSGAKATAFIASGASSSNVQPAAATVNLVPVPIGSVQMQATGSGYTSTPGIMIAPGANNAAYATVSLMPYGVSGAAIESYASRAWFAHPHQKTSYKKTGDVLNISAPSNLSNFATSSGGLIYTSNSPVLRSAYTALKTVGDFLYVIGDSSVDVISNVQTNGNPSSTTFNENNTDPQIGTSWPYTVQDFSRTALFANALGVYGLYGGSVTKVSEKMDDIFSAAAFPPTAGALTPSGAVAEIYEKKTYLLLMTVFDPLVSQYRNVMLEWDEKEWGVASQTIVPIFIGTEMSNSVPSAWGTDGTTLFPMFSTPSASLTKKFSTKLYGARHFPMVQQSMSIHAMTTDKSSGATGVILSGTIDNEETIYALSSSLNFGVAAQSNATPIVSIDAGSGSIGGSVFGCYLGLTLSSTSEDFELNHLSFGYRLYWSGFGSPPSTV